MSKHLFILLLFLCFICPACAKEPDAIKSPETVNNVELAAKLDDAKTFEDIESYLQVLSKNLQAEVSKIEKRGKATFETVAPYMKTMAEQTVAAGEKLLALASDDAQRKEAYLLLIQGLKSLDDQETNRSIEKLKKERNLSEEDAQNRDIMLPLVLKALEVESEAKKRLVALLAELEKDGRFAEVVVREKFGQFMDRAMQFYGEFNSEKFELYKKEAKDWANEKMEGVNPMVIFESVVNLAGTEKALEVDPACTQKTLDEMIAFVKSTECQLGAREKSGIVAYLEDTKKHAPGTMLNLYGKTLDGKDFDWKSLRGKYVLVKFTAWWCVPCKMQLPYMKAAYSKYKDKGFEIVSVYVLKNQQRMQRGNAEEKQPWICLSEDVSTKAGMAPQSDAFAIQAVPTMLLVDKNGMVISTEVQGPKLEQKLAELLGN